MSIDQTQLAQISALAQLADWENWEPSGDPTKMPTNEIFKCVWAASGDINNGGFEQFFENSTGDRTADIIYSYRSIGLARAAELLEEAQILVFGGEAPASQKERERLNKLHAECSADTCFADQHESAKRLEELEDIFFGLSDATDERLLKFLIDKGLLVAPDPRI